MGNSVGSSAIKPAATIGIMAVKILFQGGRKENIKKSIKSNDFGIQLFK